MNQNQTSMSEVIPFFGLDVHKESVAVSLETNATDVRQSRSKVRG